jgi:D-xylose transport system substrate-binding protein
MRRLVVRRTLLIAAGALAGSALLSGCTPKAPPVIGFSIDDMRIERWVRDRDYFVEAAKALGVNVKVRSADGDEQRQIQQIEGFIEKKVAAIVIVPNNAKVLTKTIDMAKQAGIKVISYDRMILDADVDAYISFDNERVGAMQAEGVVKAMPKGDYFLLGGAPTDNNAKLLREGQMKVLKPYIDKGDIKLIGDQWVTDWNPNEAQAIITKVLAQNDNKIDGIVASNDGTAGGAIQALTTVKLAGKVAVSGQDADVDACKRVLAGTQTMTVYKPLKLIATEAAKLTVAMLKGDQVSFTTKLDNGRKKVDSLLLQPTTLTKENMHVVVDDGFFTKEDLGMK